jgi:hypothetical protein
MVRRFPELHVSHFSEIKQFGATSVAFPHSHPTALAVGAPG